MSLDSIGYSIVENVVGRALITALIDRFHVAIDSPSSIDRNGHTFALRNLLRDQPIIRQLADSPTLRALVDPILGPAAIAVRGILFDKTPGANWKVPWHQDLSIAVAERVDLPGYGPWSVKAGVKHVQPPEAILQNMLTVRLHLDDCGIENGPLLVIPGTHALGILKGKQIDQLRQTSTAVPCIAGAGGAVLMRPLLLHASHSAVAPGHRRVVHLEYAAAVLPPPLRWFIA
jgi:ectoine hydroxylase-related dioxygenase (phytanoyl-CoA dioxygenase family)